MDAQDAVLIDFAERVARRSPELRGTRDSGAHASRVMIAAPQGSSFDGRRGVVVRQVDDTVFVRMSDRGRELTLPFGLGEVEVLP